MDAQTIAGVVAMLVLAAAAFAVICALALSGRISRGQKEL